MNIDQITNTANVDRTKKGNCFNRRIKGPAALSEFVKIPEQVLLDKMHSTARGAQENLNNLWFNPNFDKRLSGVEYHIIYYDVCDSY